MPHFRKKPITIEAFQLPMYERDMPDWINSPDIIFKRDETGMIIEALIATREGVMTASINDWIIRGVKGELYPCKPDIFAASYEPIPGDQKNA